jgi:hypothetical protein
VIYGSSAVVAYGSGGSVKGIFAPVVFKFVAVAEKGNAGIVAINADTPITNPLLDIFMDCNVVMFLKNSMRHLINCTLCVC